jgi:hypothetical protein
MAICKECKNFKPLKQSDLDYVEGKGDCFLPQQDEKSKFWTSRPVKEDIAACDRFEKK